MLFAVIALAVASHAHDVENTGEAFSKQSLAALLLSGPGPLRWHERIGHNTVRKNPNPKRKFQKMGMTQLWDDAGNHRACTVLKEYNGKAQKNLRYLQGKLDPDITDEMKENLIRGVTPKFKKGDRVDISGKSKGKGFAGTIKRWGFARGPMTHGSKNHRLPGSIGACATPGRVLPGKKMAGQMGNKGSTIKNAEVFWVNEDKGIIVVTGCAPGGRKSILDVRLTNYQSKGDVEDSPFGKIINTGL